MNNNIIGLDIAKNIFHICVMSRGGKVRFKKQLRRVEVLEFFANYERSLIAVEACGGSNYWSRELSKLGHEVRIISAQYVKPYVKSQKNDEIDSEAIAEACLRPTMRYVSSNTVEQQDLQNVHRVRERLVKQRQAISNQIRGLLMEYGVVIPKGFYHLRKYLIGAFEFDSNRERVLWKVIFEDLKLDFLEVEEKLKGYDKLIVKISKQHEEYQKLEQIPGVGPLTSTAVLAAVGSANDFKNGRQFSAWLGLVPQQYSTGGKARLLGISKRGDKYIRKLLVHGARSSVQYAKKHDNKWLLSVKERRGYNKASVAYANKNARRIWQLLAHPEMEFKLAA